MPLSAEDRNKCIYLCSSDSRIDDIISFMIDRFKKYKKYRTLSIYAGMGEWLFVHRCNGRYKIHCGEKSDYKNMTDFFEEALVPYDFYNVYVEEYADNNDNLYIGVEPKDIDENKHICHQWKAYRLDPNMTSYEDEPLSEE